MTFVVIYVNDELHPTVYGPFRSVEKAIALSDRIEASIDDDRDDAGGGAGWVYWKCVLPPAAWGDD